MINSGFAAPADIIASIRERPGMYIGDPGAAGVERLIYELVANGIDQFLANTARKIGVKETAGNVITVSDDGPGLPYDQLLPSGISLPEHWLTEIHNTPTADNHSPHVHLYSGGAGLIVVNALSKSLRVVTHRAGIRWEQRFAKGRTAIRPTQRESSGRGTTISFVIDPSVLRAQSPRWPQVRRKLFDTAHLFPGVLLGCGQEIFHAANGLTDLATFAAAEPDSVRHEGGRLVSIDEQLDGVRVRAAIAGEGKDTQWTSWCNGNQTVLHGSHVDGLRDALRRAKWVPKVAMINVLMTGAHFAGPTKDHLCVLQIREIVRELVSRSL